MDVVVDCVISGIYAYMHNTYVRVWNGTLSGILFSKYSIRWRMEISLYSIVHPYIQTQGWKMNRMCDQLKTKNITQLMCVGAFQFTVSTGHPEYNESISRDSKVVFSAILGPIHRGVCDN